MESGRQRRLGPFRVALARGDFRKLVLALTVSQAGDWLYNVGFLVFIIGSASCALAPARGWHALLALRVFNDPIPTRIARTRRPCRYARPLQLVARGGR